MRSGERLALAIILGLGVIAFGTAGATAYAWQRAGSVRIAIHETRPGGDDLTLKLPGLLLNAAIALCPVPADTEFKARLHDVAPALRAVAQRLDAMPDAVLVDAVSDDSTVRVEKSGTELLIRLISREERVEIALPLGSVHRLLTKLEA